MKSIRRQLLFSLLIGFLTLLLAGGYLSHRIVKDHLNQALDRSLLTKAQALAALVEPEVFGIEFNFSKDTMPEYASPAGGDFFEIWTEEGSIIARSPSLEKSDLPQLSGTQENPGTGIIEDGKGRRLRVLGLRLPLRDADFRAAPGEEEKLAKARLQLGMPEVTHVIVSCARELASLEATLSTLRLGLFIAGLAMLVAVAVLVGFYVGHAFRPVRRLANTVSELPVEKLERAPLEVAGPRELEPFRLAFQRFTKRIAETMARERRLTANIAHELRTPVAELRTVTEIAKTWIEDTALTRRSLEDAHEISLQMDRLLRTCLRMARLESGQSVLDYQEVDLSKVLAELCRQTREFANRRRLELIEEIPAQCRVTSDPEILELIFGNLLDNAFHHATDGSWVKLEVSTHDGCVEVRLSNPAQDLDAADLAHMTEPFWRKEEARTDTRHLGLGLAMVSSATRAVGARIDFQVVDARFEVCVRLQLSTISVSSTRSPVMRSISSTRPTPGA